MTRSAQDWPMTERVWQLADMLDEMCARLGIEGAAARIDEGEGLAAARLRCMSCSESDRCVAWLGGSPDAASPPEYCPNAAFLTRCLEETARRRSAAPQS